MKLFSELLTKSLTNVIIWENVLVFDSCWEYVSHHWCPERNSNKNLSCIAPQKSAFAVFHVWVLKWQTDRVVRHLSADKINQVLYSWWNCGTQSVLLYFVHFLIDCCWCFTIQCWFLCIKCCRKKKDYQRLSSPFLNANELNWRHISKLTTSCLMNLRSGTFWHRKILAISRSVIKYLN